MDYWVDHRRFYPNRKEIPLVNVWALVLSLVLTAIIFTGLGYFWHYQQVTTKHRQEISKLEEKVNYYRQHWTPMRETPRRARVK